MKEPAIIIDLDGTLANITVRRLFLTGEKKDWKSFNRSLESDTLNQWCKILIDHLKAHYRVLIVSGRTNELREQTLTWLRQHEVHFDHLFMRPDHDSRADQLLKLEIYQASIKPHYQVLLVLDDRSKVVQMWRSQGLVCLQCDNGDF